MGRNPRSDLPIVVSQMDKKSKKRIDVLRSNLQRLRQQLAGEQKQSDDLAESQSLTKQIALIEAELQTLMGNPGSVSQDQRHLLPVAGPQFGHKTASKCIL